MILNQEKTEKAKEFINNGNLLAAENILSGLEDKCSIFELAKIRKIQGRNMEAEKLYLKSLSMPSEIKSHIDSDINLELGRIYAGFGKVKEAQYRYGKGLDRISLENNIYRELGSLYLRTKEYEKAKENLEKAKKMFPNDIPTNFELAMLYRVLGKDDLSKTIFNRLLTEKEIKTNKFLYNKILNEYEILMKKEYLESKPREIRNAITTKCNASCRYCDVWKDNMGWSQNERVTKEVVDLFPYLESAHWLGGETFLYKGFEEILEEGFKYDNLTQTILTNGLLINERILNKMAQCKGKKLRLIIAIDAGKKETYEYLRRGSSWEKLCGNLELIKEINRKGNRIHTTFNTVISKSNYREIFDMVEMAHKYDFNKIRFMPILGNSSENIFSNRALLALRYVEGNRKLLEKRAREYGLEYEYILPTEEISYVDTNLKYAVPDKYKLFKSKNGFKCFHPWMRIVIDQKGPVRPCENCCEWLGDTTNQTIDEYWNSRAMQIYRKKFSEGYICANSGYHLQNSSGYINFGPNDLVDIDLHMNF